MIKGTAISLKDFDAPVSKSSLPLERTRALVLPHVWNTTSYQILNPGIKRWFSDSFWQFLARCFDGSQMAATVV